MPYIPKEQLKELDHDKYVRLTESHRKRNTAYRERQRQLLLRPIRLRQPSKLKPSKPPKPLSKLDLIALRDPIVRAGRQLPSDNQTQS